jgi:hypothetical protein
MVKIYISYNRRDAATAETISERLSGLGYDIFRDRNELVPGVEWEPYIVPVIGFADVFISLLSENSITSPYIQTELEFARANKRRSNDILIVPVILGNIEVPPFIRDLQPISSPDTNIGEVIIQIELAITAFLGRRAAEEKQKIEVKERIESNAASYVEEAIKSLIVHESRNRRRSDFWYYLGYATLIAGVIFGIYSIAQFSNSTDQSWIRYAYLALKSLIVVGLLIACSKYAFTLGKSYTNEALKGADRIHAISFGRFYLRAFGEKSDWTQLKEVFQHWNIDKSSAFSSLDGNSFDPKFVETLIELVKVVTSQSNTKS